SGVFTGRRYLSGDATLIFAVQVATGSPDLIVSPPMSLHRMARRIASSASLLLLLLLFGAVAVSGAEGPIKVSNVRLAISGSVVRAEFFEGQGERKRPTVLVLHGAGGTLLDGPEMRRVARHLAADGNAVYLIRYFEGTGTLFALDSTMQRHFRTWLETVRASIVAVQGARGDAAPVGLYGYSLGGFLALSAASDNPRVGAVVEHAGGVWNGRLETIRKMPPVLLLHGKRDGRVPFEKYAEPLVPVLRTRARSLETRFFPEESHVFTPAAMGEVRESAARFFKRHLVRREAGKAE
ncbi:MAG: dienelactone hydrolase family protein, partial [Verrucomicrobiota bacterium]|nr:dienelactone hydrolase family protein [Verrucomicrobiota bacterium]